MKKLFIPHELAYKICEKGYNEPGFGYWLCKNSAFGVELEITDNFIDLINYDSSSCLAPLYQQVIDWFRKKYNIHLSVDFDYLTDKYDIMFQEKTKGKWERYTKFYNTKTPNEALDLSIEEALKLI